MSTSKLKHKQKPDSNECNVIPLTYWMMSFRMCEELEWRIRTFQTTEPSMETKDVGRSRACSALAPTLQWSPLSVAVQGVQWTVCNMHQCR